jgi:hypothetical protein
MTNYDKKRKRQAGRQGVGSESERDRIYRQGYFDGQAALIERFQEAKVLPRLDFKMVPQTQEEFKKDYPNG